MKQNRTSWCHGRQFLVHVASRMLGNHLSEKIKQKGETLFLEKSERELKKNERGEEQGRKKTERSKEKETE